MNLGYVRQRPVFFINESVLKCRLALCGLYVPSGHWKGRKEIRSRKSWRVIWELPLIISSFFLFFSFLGLDVNPVFSGVDIDVGTSLMSYCSLALCVLDCSLSTFPWGTVFRPPSHYLSHLTSRSFSFPTLWICFHCLLLLFTEKFMVYVVSRQSKWNINFIRDLIFIELLNLWDLRSIFVCDYYDNRIYNLLSKSMKCEGTTERMLNFCK